MHFQQSIPNWHDALLKLPNRALLKGFDAGLLREGKETWTAAGRDPARLYTLFRYAGSETAPAGDWESAKAHWRRTFARWVDRTYLEVNGRFVDYVSESNEYTATSTWSDPDGGAVALQNAQAAAWVWNNEYRGRTVTSADGGHGAISASCKLCLLAGPVANYIPRAIFDLSLDEDCPIDYHAYALCHDGLRVPEDWREHSGYWNTLEQEHGLYPEWVFGESGPYRSTFEGWRSANVLNGDVGKLVSVMHDWIADVVQTRAYREGRVIGTGAWFTSGRVGGWENYELDTPELVAISDAIRPLWVEPAPEPRARVQDVSGLYQDPAQMHYAEWRAQGFALGFYEVAIGTRLIRWAQEHHDAMRAAGYLTGPYLALHEDADPVAQASLLVLQRRMDDDGPSMLDFERDGLSETMLRLFCDQYDRVSKWPLWIYTRKGFWEAKVPAARRARYAQYGLYIAAWPYDSLAGEPVPMDPVSVELRSTPPDDRAPGVPDPWLRFDAWQHTGQGSLEGYNKFLDLAVYNGTEAQLYARFPRQSEPGADDMDEALRQALVDQAVGLESEANSINERLAAVRVELADLEGDAAEVLARAGEIKRLLPAPEPLFRVQMKPGVTINIRSGPSTAFADVGDTAPGAIYDVWQVDTDATDGVTGWYKISAAESKWISGSASYSVRV